MVEILKMSNALSLFCLERINKAREKGAMEGQNSILAIYQQNLAS